MATLTTENQTFPGFVYAEQSTFCTGPNSVPSSPMACSSVSRRRRSAASRKAARWRSISAELARAKAAGRETPVVVGAIPFDTRRPSSLYVPEKLPVCRQRQLYPRRAPDAATGASPAACTSIPDEPRFKHAVAEAVSRFKQGKLDKAVLSRILDIELEQPVAGHQILNNLMVQNPTGYHFSCRWPMAAC